MQSIIFRCHKTFASFWIFMTWTLHQLQPEHDLIKTSYGTNIKLTVCFSRQRNSAAQKRPNTFIYMMLSIRSFPLFYAHYCLFILTSHPCAYLCSYESISTFSSQQSFGMTLSSAICFVSSTDHRPFITVTLRMFYSALTESWECANSHIVFVYVCLSVFICGCVRNTRVC